MPDAIDKLAKETDLAYGRLEAKLNSLTAHGKVHPGAAVMAATKLAAAAAVSFEPKDQPGSALKMIPAMLEQFMHEAYAAKAKAKAEG